MDGNKYRRNSIACAGGPRIITQAQPQMIRPAAVPRPLQTIQVPKQASPDPGIPGLVIAEARSLAQASTTAANQREQQQSANAKAKIDHR